MSFNELINDNAKALLKENKLESIVNETNVLTTAGVVVGDGPSEIVPYSSNTIYVVNSASNSISVIDTATSIVTDTIEVGDTPSDIVPYYNTSSIPNSITFYVANFNSGTVSVIDPATNNVTDTIEVGDGASSIAASYDTIYVANINSYTVSVIDPATNNVINTIEVEALPSSIAVVYSDTAYLANGSSIATYSDTIYVANSGSNTISVIDPATNNVIDTIEVGESPGHVVPYSSNTIYVVNSASNSISVIDPATNNVTDTIEVGDKPISIATLFDIDRPNSKIELYTSNTIYVVNSASNSISVIDTATSIVTDTIEVGNKPISIAAYSNTVYVVNSASNTVSVIDSATNNVMNTIEVGRGPRSIFTFPANYYVGMPFIDVIYVANSASNTVSVIDPAMNEVVAGVTFDVIPFRGGQINCNRLDAPINRHFYVSSGSGCVAKPNNGYEFASWVEMFADNSTRTINASTTSDWLVDPVAAFRNVFTDDQAANLTIDKFGNFTAYFKALPPPVPAEFTFSLITIVVTALVGSLLIPAAVGWSRSKKQTSRLNAFHMNMISINKDGLDEKDIGDLDDLNQSISNSYASGKITNGQYANLKNEVSAAYQKIFKKRIESLTNQNLEAVNNIKNEVKDAYSDRKITELDYNLLLEKISDTLDNK